MPLSMSSFLRPTDIVVFDNLLNFTQAKSTRVTSHPVELGPDVSDNAQPLPTELIFSVQVTRTPLNVPLPAAVELATEWFERNDGQQITVNAPAGVFQGYIITRFAYDETVGQRIFNVTAREIVIADSVSVPIPSRLPVPVAANGLESAADGGVQSPVEKDPADISKTRSLLSLAF